MKCRLAFRGFQGKTVVFEESATVNEFDMPEVLPKLAEAHAEAMARGDIHMIEIEFLDDPNPNSRFFRFGTDPAGMVVPIKIDLSPEGLELLRSRCGE